MRRTELDGGARFAPATPQMGNKHVEEEEEEEEEDEEYGDVFAKHA